MILNFIQFTKKIVRSFFKSTIKLAKKKYYCRRFSSVQGNMKKTWALINELRGKSKQSIKSCFKIDGVLVEDQREIANGFNTFFSSIARNMNAKLCLSRPVYHIDSGNKKFTDYLGNRISSSMFFFRLQQQ